MARIVVEVLTKSHDRQAFNCGNEELNAFLKTKARKHADQNISVTWVAVESGEFTILGFITLTLGTLAFENVDPDITRGLPRYPLPVIHVGRLAVDLAHQGRGIGSLLLKAAALHAIEISQKVGCMGMELVAKDEAAVGFYVRRGFRQLSPGSMRLYVSIPHLRASLEAR